MFSTTNPDRKRTGSEQVGLAEILASTLLGGGIDAVHHLAVEFALTEASRGHVECAHQALRNLPEQHLRSAITGAALLSHLATDILTARRPVSTAAAEPAGKSGPSAASPPRRRA